MKEQGVISAMFNDSMADTTPLKKLLAKYIIADIVKTIAGEDIYAFCFSQKGLMAGLGLQGSKITKINPDK